MNLKVLEDLRRRHEKEAYGHIIPEREPAYHDLVEPGIVDYAKSFMPNAKHEEAKKFRYLRGLFNDRVENKYNPEE